jgi:hypothetical protein
MSIAVERAVQGLPVLWGAPTFDQVRVSWDESRKAAGNVVDFKASTMTANFPTGGRIIYRSLDDPDNARGHTTTLIVIDEAGDVNPAAWNEVLQPMLIDTGGEAWLIGTPKGRNWFWSGWIGAHDRDDSMSWQVPTVGCEIQDGVLYRKPHPLENPEIPFAEIQRIYRDTPESSFRQEILAEFLENEGAVFRNIAACLHAPNDDAPGQHAAHNVVMGVDWGKHQDFTALSVFCGDCRRELALDRFNQIDYAVQRGRLAALATRWKVRHILAEANSVGEPIIEQLQREGLPVSGFMTTPSSKPPLIESLALAFEREEAQWLNDPTWNFELEAYERKVSTVTGRSQYSAPEGVHDDTVIARALAWQAVTGTPATYGYSY